MRSDQEGCAVKFSTVSADCIKTKAVCYSPQPFSNFKPEETRRPNIQNCSNTIVSRFVCAVFKMVGFTASQSVSKTIFFDWCPNRSKNT